MISHRLAIWSLLVTAAVAGPALVQSSVYGQGFFDCDSYYEVDDLDQLPECLLVRDLDNELGPDDFGFGFDEYVGIAELAAEIMWALSDENDDPSEEEIDFDDLAREIDEAYPGSSLQDLVEQVLLQVDAQASQQRGWAFVRVQLGLRPGDGRVIVGPGVSAVKQAIRQATRVYR